MIILLVLSGVYFIILNCTLVNPKEFIDTTKEELDKYKERVSKIQNIYRANINIGKNGQKDNTQDMYNKHMKHILGCRINITDLYHQYIIISMDYDVDKHKGIFAEVIESTSKISVIQISLKNKNYNLKLLMRRLKYSISSDKEEPDSIEKLHLDIKEETLQLDKEYNQREKLLALNKEYNTRKKLMIDLQEKIKLKLKELHKYVDELEEFIGKLKDTKANNMVSK